MRRSQKEKKQELSLKKEQMRQDLLLQEETFQKELVAEQQKHDEKITELEESMKKQLLDKEEVCNKLLAMIIQQWEASAQEWAHKQKVLEEKFLENQDMRQEEEKKEGRGDPKKSL